MSGNPTIKYSAITRAGYEYQDLVGIEVLIRHYRDPLLFSWVQLECDDPAIKSLDDVVAKRMDGSIEYTQVKFTVDADKYALDWDWLLDKTKGGTSMLAKWAKSFARAKANGPVHSAQLKTNRIPSPDFTACLKGKLVDLSLVRGATRTLIETECGGKNEAETFFREFVFAGGMPDIDRFERFLRDQLVPTDTNESGWLLLLNSVKRWCIHKNEPPPDGKILRQHILQLISERRPHPLRQDFAVPEGYAAPSVAFDQVFRKRIFDDARPITILWGTPGRGKSTYLSYLTKRLQDKNEAVIRHHYFLSSEDMSSNRTSFVDIANSLIDQLTTRYARFTAGVTRDPDHLATALRIAGGNLAEKGKHLFLVIDGLDHVYRDTQRVDQLNHLFASIMPLPPNVVLIVGTQRIDDQQLPSRLLTRAADADWIEIPRMDQVAVRRWVHTQDEARPLFLRWALTGERRADEIEEIAVAMYMISRGHPLHLIYAYETMIRSGNAVSADDVKALPPCPDGDIRTYYKSLWVKLRLSAKSILHVLAGSDFYWPPLGIRQTLGDYGEIDFLLEPRNSGMIPFHPSIFAWVREREDHEVKYKALLPKIIQWLEESAPDYWRWGWLWLAKAQNGDASDLLAGATRQWAVDSLTNGWSERQMISILSAAENLTFARGDLAQTTRLRTLKTRISNVREFQSKDYGFFRATALSISDNRQQTINLLDDLQDLSDEEVASLAYYGPSALRGDIVRACLHELARRVDSWVELRHRPANEFAKLSDQLLRVAALSGRDAVPRIVRYLRRFKDPEDEYVHYVQLLADAQDIDALQVAAKIFRGDAWIDLRWRIQEHIVRTALYKGVDPTTLLNQEKQVTPLACALLLKIGNTNLPPRYIPPIPINLLRKKYAPADSVDFESLFYQSFWIALTMHWQATGEFSAIYPGLPDEGIEWIRESLFCFEAAAQGLAKGTLPFAFSTIYETAKGIRVIPLGNAIEPEHAQYLGFRKSIRRIAIELHLMGLSDKTSPAIPACELAKVRQSKHWSDLLWCADNAETQHKLLDRPGANDMLVELSAQLSGKVTVFNERSEYWTQYASLAALYDVADARILLRRASECLLGYGWRKDLGAIDVLESIEHIHSSDPSNTLRWVKEMAPGVDQITEFTDGDETDHVRSQLIETVGKTLPDRLSQFYEHHLAADEWRYADETLEAIIGVAELSSPEAAALSATLLDTGTLLALEKRVPSDPMAQTLLDRQIKFLGKMPNFRRDYSTPDSITLAQQEAANSDPSVFAATDFEGLAEFVSGRGFHYKFRKEFMAKWLHHWEVKGTGKIALSAIAAFFESGKSILDIVEILDAAFDVSLRLEGKKEAYKWIVTAHVERNGWHSYWASEKEIMARLQRVAKVYPDRWDEFLKDSSQPMSFFRRRGDSPSIGYKYLVRFLILVGQIEIASQVTEGFITSFVEELADQPIPEAAWLH